MAARATNAENARRGNMVDMATSALDWGL